MIYRHSLLVPSSVTSLEGQTVMPIGVTLQYHHCLLNQMLHLVMQTIVYSHGYYNVLFTLVKNIIAIYTDFNLCQMITNEPKFCTNPLALS